MDRRLTPGELTSRPFVPTHAPAMLPTVARRILSLSLVLLAGIGLVGPRAHVITHSHEGGNDTHHHGPRLSTFGHHGHSHALGHSSHSHHDSGEPNDESVPPGDGHDDGDDRHQHVGAAPDATYRRAGETSPAAIAVLAARVSTPCWMIPVAPRASPSVPPPRRPNDARGRPTSNGRSTIERLLQGIGLLI